MPKDLKNVRGRASKQMAHITYDRLKAVGDAKQWAYREIFDAIMAGVEVFKRNANPELLHADWDNA